jgi:hypothetical protein
LESDRESQLGICYECNTKNADSSQKPVFHCDLCEKWFCKEHLEPKFPYFVDWDTVFNVGGDPRIKLLYHTQHGREGGHPDYIYARKKIEASELDEKMRDELIKQAMDRMEAPDSKGQYEIWEKQAKENQAQARARYVREVREKKEEAKLRATGMITTTENKFGNRFVVPLAVYSHPLYREYLNYAKTMKSVKVIVDEYFEKYPEEKPKAKEETTKEQQEPEKKKHGARGMRDSYWFILSLLAFLFGIFLIVIDILVVIMIKTTPANTPLPVLYLVFPIGPFYLSYRFYKNALREAAKPTQSK